MTALRTGPLPSGDGLGGRVVTVALAVAGLLVGVALAARKQGAARAWAAWALVLAALPLGTAVLLAVRR